MRKVRILLSGPAQNNLQSYVDAVNGVGAEAVVEYLQTSDRGYDGLILCGGGDIDPKYYSEEVNGSAGINPERDAAEFSLMDAFVQAGKPIMGICRGHQFVNVYFGGSLYQYIPEADLHTGGKAHVIAAEPDSILRNLYGASFSVNSTHHQAVKKLGNGLRVTALWEGKHVEAMEHASLPVISVQWHPEAMCFNRKREDTVDGAKIIEYFVQMCTKTENA